VIFNANIKHVDSSVKREWNWNNHNSNET
jgi:hypothetical protein